MVTETTPLYAYGVNVKPLMNDAYLQTTRTSRPIETTRLPESYVSPFKHRPRKFVPRGLSN